MDKIRIHGGKKLKGTVSISGSKNAALPIMVASLLTDDEICLENVPKLRDINTMIRVLEHLGKHIKRDNGCLIIKKDGAIKCEAPYELVSQMRASALVIGPLLARCKKVNVALPGGCAIGARPINIHLDGLKALGAQMHLIEGYEHLECKHLKGTRIVLDYPSVGATENLLMAAVLAQGKTIIENAAQEPEITDLANFLISMGANIKGLETNTLTIRGVKTLQGTTYRVIPDRIEAGTFMIAAAITRGKIVIKNATPHHLTSLTSRLEEAGAEIISQDDDIIVEASDGITPLDIETLPYPGFPTDMQAQWMALMCTAKGSSTITETVFENRFMHVLELCRMGANLKIKGHTVFAKGNDKLSGAKVMATDLRASAALILAGLVAKGFTTISRVYHLDRGYERIEEKLKKLGADIERVTGRKI